MSDAPPPPWSMQYFEQELARYDAVARPRYIKLFAWLVGIWGVVFVALGAPAATHHFLPTGIVLSLVAVLFVSLIGLAAYVLATSSTFHREHALSCPTCSAPQTYSPGERYILLPHLKRTHRPIKCKGCGAIIAV